jgi:hypothetical protein
LEDPCVDGKIMWVDLREIGQEGVDWMHMVQDNNQLWVLVNMVMSLCVP